MKFSKICEDEMSDVDCLIWNENHEDVYVSWRRRSDVHGPQKWKMLWCDEMNQNLMSLMRVGVPLSL